MALLRSFATVGGYTGVSRVLGFLRDILIADQLGTGPIADAFFVAFRLPNLFRRLFGEGAFNAAFVPLFARRLEQDGEAAAKAFGEQALAVLLTGLLGFTAAAMAAMPWLMYLLAPGFAADPEKFDLAVQLSRITFPYLLFLSLVALLSGILNALYRFAAAAAAPILLNIFAIAALVAVVPLTGRPGHVLAWTVAAAGAGQFLLLAFAAARAGMALRLPRPRLTPAIRRLFRLMIPGVLSAGALQINIVVGTIIASLQAGAVSYLYYADRIYQLPLGMIGIAIGVVLLPDLSRKLRGGAQEAAMATLNRGLELALFFTVPAAVALVVIPLPIITVLFERGAFDRSSSEATAWALAAFALGLPAYVLVKILQPGFFAREDTVTPLRFAAISVGANIALSLALFWRLGHVGLALATALAAWLNAALLGITLKRRGFLTLDPRLRRRLPRIAAASLIMGAALWIGWTALAGWFEGGLSAQVAALGLLVGGGLGLYGALALAFRAAAVQDIKALLSRGT
jgi:putative peptidoglycan lipid II flippase